MPALPSDLAPNGWPRDLLRGFKAGERAALTEVCGRHAEEVALLLRRGFGSGVELQDILRETFRRFEIDQARAQGCRRDELLGFSVRLGAEELDPVAAVALGKMPLHPSLLGVGDDGEIRRRSARRRLARAAEGDRRRLALASPPRSRGPRRAVQRPRSLRIGRVRVFDPCFTVEDPAMISALSLALRFPLLLVLIGAVALFDPRLARAGRPEGPLPLAGATLEADGTARFALVIGSNATRSKEQKPLRFADDDAARIAELWLELGAEVELLTVFDHVSQARFPELIERAQQPTTARLDAAWARLHGKMEAAAAAGREVELLIYYAGHGDLGPDGQGFLTLENGDALTRSDLFGKLLGASPADRNHVIVDACRSEQFVLSRGEWKPDRDPADYGESVREYLDGNHLGAHPNTGVVLAHSADQQTHEWERWQGGIFTHQLLSGLRGGADINGDGRIEYSELGAFVSAANSGVGDPRARLEITVRPPRGDERAPLLVHERVTEQRVLLLAGADAGRYSLEDGRGVRLADLNHAPGQPAYLRLPSGPLYLYRHDPKDGSRIGEARIARIARVDAGVIALGRLEFDEPESDARGPLDDALRTGLFKVAYGSGYYAGYTAQEQLLAVAEPDWEIQVWRRDPETGELVEVARVGGDVPQPQPQREAVIIEEIEYVGPCDWCWDRSWLSISVGAEFNVLAPSGRILLPQRRITANEMPGFDDQGFPAALRGVDVRVGAFSGRNPFRYPFAEGYFRSGYTEGHTSFIPADSSRGFVRGDALELDYLTVPLFFGGNFYFPRKWPVRPYAGLGAGFDVMRIRYRRFDADDYVAAGLRIGFELHAGIDIRISNYFGLFGEVRQLWSARIKTGGVLPDVGNTGFTVVSGLKFGIPVGPGAAATTRGDPARARKRKVRVVRPQPQVQTSGGQPSKPAGAPEPAEDVLAGPDASADE
ncbi:MAG: caspase family protein [Enhygromyxa sp.]